MTSTKLQHASPGTSLVLKYKNCDNEPLQVQASSQLYLSGACIHTSASTYMSPLGFTKLPDLIYFTRCIWM